MPGTVHVVPARRSVLRAGMVAALLFLLGPGPVGAQVSGRPSETDLRIEWSPSEDRRGRPIVSGYIYNQRAGSYATGVDALPAIAEGGAAPRTGNSQPWSSPTIGFRVACLVKASG